MKEIDKKNKVIEELKEDNKYLEGAINKLRVSASVADLSYQKLSQNNSHSNEKSKKLDDFSEVVNSKSLNNFR